MNAIARIFGPQITATREAGSLAELTAEPSIVARKRLMPSRLWEWEWCGSFASNHRERQRLRDALDVVMVQRREADGTTVQYAWRRPARRWR